MPGTRAQRASSDPCNHGGQAETSETRSNAHALLARLKLFFKENPTWQ
jgi:hypothetical protein